MKKVYFVVISLFAFTATAQKAEIVEKNGKYGLYTDFGKELLPMDYEMITKCRTDSFDYYIADLVGSSEIYSYNSQKRDIYDEAPKEKFTVITWEWHKPSKKNIFYGVDDKGNKKQLAGHEWQAMKVKGMIGCKNSSGKFAVCQAGKALTDYTYLEIDAKHKNLVVVRTDTGWIALDAKMKGHYDWSFDEIHDSDVHPESFIVRKGKKWGILSLDGSMNLQPSVMKNPDQMFDFDGDSYAELERAYAVQRSGKWGIVDEKDEELTDFKYDNAYMIDDFAIEQHSLTSHAVVNEGGTWKFLNEKWEEHKTLDFDSWIGVHGNVALVMKDGKVWEVDLKTFDMHSNLYFGDYQDIEVVKNEDGMIGVVGKLGEVILPFEFIFIEHNKEGEEDAFLIADKAGKGGIYDITGKNLVPHNYEAIIYLEDKGGKTYMSIGRVGESALAWWDKETNKIIRLSEPIYKLISFKHSDGSFLGETNDDVFHKMDDNGKLIEDE